MNSFARGEIRDGFSDLGEGHRLCIPHLRQLADALRDPRPFERQLILGMASAARIEDLFHFEAEIEVGNIRWIIVHGT